MTTELKGLVTGKELQAASLPALEWTIPGLLPEGFGILAARPKAGKSCLVLGIGLAVAAGRPALGVEVESRPVLYLALEDGWRRLSARCLKILGEAEAFPSAISFGTESSEALAQAEAFASQHDSALIILDTLAVVKPTRKSREDPYASDYAFARRLKSFAKPGVTVLAVHHTRKADADNSIDTVSGTHGTAGAADFVMVLDRKQGASKAVLHVTGRDVDEADYSLIFDDGKWNPDGNGLVEAAERAATAHFGTTKRGVIDFVNSRPLTRTSEVVEHLGISQVSARQTLSRLCKEGQIGRAGNGVYNPVTMSHFVNKAA